MLSSLYNAVHSRGESSGSSITTAFRNFAYYLFTITFERTAFKV